MATIDDTRGVLVVRIVYDGPALSGKTTSLRALARGVASKVECPEEQDGRTLYFDWVDYVGGLFEGRQIRCQIVSVPGQRELVHRRKLLLETADVVVLVLDTRRSEWEFGLGWVRDAVPSCRGKDPPVGLVIQANKRDAPDAVPREELRESLAAIGIMATVESTATVGDGIREGFVLAVRLALDRVRALSATGRLGTGRPAEDGAEELLAKLREGEGRREVPISPAFAESVEQSLEEELGRWIPEMSPPLPMSGDPGDERLFVPDPMMPGGMIWPPVDGRALLHEVATLGIRPARTHRADWWGAGSGFRFHSVGEALFSDPQVARKELIEWARLHSANAPHLSTGRAVILSDAGAGRLRLWQLVRADATLRERLAAAPTLPDAESVAKELVSVASQLLASRESFKTATVPLPCTLWTIGVGGSYKPTFVGLMPTRESNLSQEPEGRALLERELAPHLRELRRTRVDYGEVVVRIGWLAAYGSSDMPGKWLSDVVAAV